MISYSAMTGTMKRTEPIKTCCLHIILTGLTLRTGCAVGIMDVAGGTAWTLEVMVETGVAAITGV